MIEEILENKLSTVAQSNAITSGRYDLTACELDIFFIVLANINSQPSGHDGKRIRIYTTDIKTITGRMWNSKQLRESVTSLGSKQIEVVIKNNEYLTIWMFQSVETFLGKGYFEVLLSEPILPYLLELKTNFTVLQLKSALSCSSKYSKRLYSLACQWRNARDGKKRFQLDELKEILGLKDPKNLKPEQYVEINAFKKNVLDISVFQINEYTDIKFEYKLIKQGRTYTAIDIFIDQKKSKFQLGIDFKESIDFQKNVRIIMKYGFSEDQGKIIAPHFKEFEKIIETLNNKIKNGALKIEHHMAYLIAVLQDKGILKKKK